MINTIRTVEKENVLFLIVASIIIIVEKHNRNRNNPENVMRDFYTQLTRVMKGLEFLTRNYRNHSATERLIYVQAYLKLSNRLISLHKKAENILRSDLTIVVEDYDQDKTILELKNVFGEVPSFIDLQNMNDY